MSHRLDLLVSRFGYRAFGFYLNSNRPLPCLAESPNAGLPEVELCLGELPADFEPLRYGQVWYQSPYKSASSGAPLLTIYTSEARGDVMYWLKYEEGTDVVVGENASKIWMTWVSSSCLEDAATFLLGSVMAVIAQLRGATCLHGCAIVVDGSIIGLLGPQGAGKSTSAAAFASAGYAVASDDIVLLSEGADGFVVEPSYPAVRLWPSSVELLFGHADALPRITEGWEKRWLNLNAGNYSFQDEPLPLAALYILGPRSGEDRAPYLTPFSGAAALMKLIGNSWAHYVDKPAFLASQFRVLTRLSQCTPVRGLVVHEDAGRLPQLCQLLVEDVRGMRGKVGVAS